MKKQKLVLIISVILVAILSAFVVYIFIDKSTYVYYPQIDNNVTMQSKITKKNDTIYYLDGDYIYSKTKDNEQQLLKVKNPVWLSSNEKCLIYLEQKGDDRYSINFLDINNANKVLCSCEKEIFNWSVFDDFFVFYDSKNDFELDVINTNDFAQQSLNELMKNNNQFEKIDFDSKISLNLGLEDTFYKYKNYMISCVNEKFYQNSYQIYDIDKEQLIYKVGKNNATGNLNVFYKDNVYTCYFPQYYILRNGKDDYIGSSVAVSTSVHENYLFSYNGGKLLVTQRSKVGDQYDLPENLMKMNNSYNIEFYTVNLESGEEKSNVTKIKTLSDNCIFISYYNQKIYYYQNSSIFSYDVNSEEKTEIYKLNKSEDIKRGKNYFQSVDGLLFIYNENKAVAKINLN